jgi:hypothetical protein
MSTTSKSSSFNLSPKVAGIVFFVFLVILGLSQWQAPSNSPGVVITIFTFIGMAGTVVKYELSTMTAPKIPQQYQAVFSTLALILSIGGGYIARVYSAYWWAGLVVVVVGAIIGAYQDLGGSMPTVTATSTA